MLVDFQKVHRDNFLIEILILNGLTNALSKEEFFEYNKNRQKSENKLIDIRMTIDGIDIDVEKFMERWQENVRHAIAENAKELVVEKFNNISNVLYDLEERVKEEVEKRMEEWEKEDNDASDV